MIITQVEVMLYTIHIQIQVDSVVSDTNGFINFWLQYMATRGETQFLKACANPTVLTPPQHMAHLVVLDPIHHLSVKIWKTQPHASTVETNSTVEIPYILNTVFSKSSNSQDHLFWAWCHPHSSPISCLGGLLWQMVIVISFRCKC